MVLFMCLVLLRRILICIIIKSAAEKASGIYEGSHWQTYESMTVFFFFCFVSDIVPCLDCFSILKFFICLFAI